MAEKYILLECNRLRAGINYSNIDEDEDEFKNQWVNNVSSYGIVVNEGDTITCESSAINSIGASDDTLEFIGDTKNNKNGYVDNVLTIDFANYVNHTGFCTVRLPLKNTRTYFSYDQIDDQQQILTKNNLLNRGLGEVFLGGFAKKIPVEDESYNNPFDLPNSSLVNMIELSKKSADVGTNYRIGGLYITGGNTKVPVPAGSQIGTGLIIKVEDTISETGKNGVPSKISIHSAGTGYNTSGGAVSLIIGNAVDGDTNGDGKQVITLHSYQSEFFKSKSEFGADGERYYPANLNYTGGGQIIYDGIPDDVNEGQNTDKLDPKFDFRINAVDLELPIGLNTPDNVATILTSQLHRPNRLNKYQIAENIDYSKYFIIAPDSLDNNQIKKPPIVETPTYKAHPAGGSCIANKFRFFNTLAGARKTYYNTIAYRNPEKIAGLQWTRQLYYGLANNDPKNQLNSGLNSQLNIGDFKNQSIGNLGLNLCVIQNFVTSATESSVLQANQGSFILTNAYFREDVLQQISEGFRRCEQYIGNTSNVYNINEDYYKNQVVYMDLGFYVDELSNGFPLTGTNQPNITRFLTNQRFRFKTFHEMTPDPAQGVAITKTVDDGAGQHPQPLNPCVGTIPNGQFNNPDGFPFNDGQQLSSMVFTSRYSDIIPNTNNPLYYDSQNISQLHQEFYDILNKQADPAQGGDPTKFSVTGMTIDEVFNGSNNGNTLDYYQNLAKKYNLSIIPVFPKNGTDFHQQGGMPYIAFVSHLALGQGKYNPIDNGITGTWQIDTRNAPYGISLGLDFSYLRNKAVQIFNANYANTSELNNKESYNSVVMMGAVNPDVIFDPTLSRFSITGLNTPMTIGNEYPEVDQLNIEATGNPEQQCYNINNSGQIAGVEQGNVGTTFTPAGGTLVSSQGQSFMGENVAQTSASFIESYTGLSIISIKFYKNTDLTESETINYYGYYEKATTEGAAYNELFPRNILEGTMLGKMGYTIDQLMPLFGDPSASFSDPLTFYQLNQTFQNKYANTPRPLTTSAFISSAEYQPTNTNSQDMPLYANGTNIGLPSNPAVEQASLTAQNLPQKLDYPYLLIYSSIIQGGTDTQYYGGFDGKSKLPCVGYITRNYNQGDFFYSLEQSFTFTATKSFTLTDITTEIRLPDGSRPRLQPHNSVIYKITKVVGSSDYGNNNMLSNNITQKNDRSGENRKKKSVPS